MDIGILAAKKKHYLGANEDFMNYLSSLGFLDKDKKSMIALVKELSDINSFSYNIEGVKKVQETFLRKAERLESKAAFIKTAKIPSVNPKENKGSTKYADILVLKKRPEAPFQCLLMGHADTVYPKESPFQKCRVDRDRLHGPGAADMKGGLVVMLKVLEAIERAPSKDQIGWTVLINGDEEIGSNASRPYIERESKGKACAIVFEPSKEDGAFIRSRPASANYLFTAEGKGAHAGRDFYLGVNAVLPLAALAMDLARISSKKRKIQVNVAKIEGGAEFNVVPHHCALSVNVRAFGEESWLSAKQEVAALFLKHQKRHRNMEMRTLSERPCKEFGKLQIPFFKTLEKCGALIGTPVTFTDSGGVTDGNLISRAGVPCIDSFGVVGKGLHTHFEEADAKSLTEKARLAALTLLTFADEYYKRLSAN